MKHQKVKIFLIIFLSIILLKISNAQELQPQNLTGSLYIDSNNLAYNLPKTKIAEMNLDVPQKKSQLLAGVLSGILPGAGEFYAERYLKAGILFVVEAAAITTAIIYNNKGNSQTQSFQNYANLHWSVTKYAEWTLNHVQNINPNVDASNYNDVLIKDNNGNVTGVNWSRLNDLEYALSGGYSHMLPHFGEQQYYELIGKYPQYSHGWDTAVMSDADYHTITPQMIDYAHKRAVANDYYATSKTGIIIIYVNHFFSIFDAVWSVNNYNKSLAVNFRFQNGNQNYTDKLDLIPTLNFSYNF